jgi:hypothetical protein
MLGDMTRLQVPENHGTYMALEDTTNGTTALHRFCTGIWVSPPLRDNVILGNGPVSLFLGQYQSIATGNFSNNALCLYVWRQSTQSLVGRIVDSIPSGVPLSGSVVPTPLLKISTDLMPNITATKVQAQAGDRLICESWAMFTPSAAAACLCDTAMAGLGLAATSGVQIDTPDYIASYVELYDNFAFQGEVFITPTSFSSIV